MPFSYAAWKELSWFRAATPIPSWVMGCKVLGKLKMIQNKDEEMQDEVKCIYESTRFSTNLGSSPFSASSRERSRVCSEVGTFPVSSSQSILSGMISFPPGAGGRTF